MPEDQAVKIRLTKRNLPKEDRRSTQKVDPSTNAMVKAVTAAAEVSRFYRDHIAKEREAGRKIYIMERDAIQILGQMKNQRLYICERPGLGETKIYAASMLWDYILPVPSESTSSGFKGERFLEFGTQVSELHGFNLQWILTAVGLLEELLFDPTGVVFAATYGDSERSPANFLGSMRFVEWSDVPATLKAYRTHQLELDGPEEAMRGVRWFRPTLQTIVAAAQRIVDLYENPLRRAKVVAGQEEAFVIRQIHIEFDSEEFKRRDLPFFDQFLALARGIAASQPTTFAALRAHVSRTFSRDFVHVAESEFE